METLMTISNLVIFILFVYYRHIFSLFYLKIGYITSTTKNLNCNSEHVHELQQYGRILKLYACRKWRKSVFMIEVHLECKG